MNEFIHAVMEDRSIPVRIVIILSSAVTAHLAVIAVRWFGRKLLTSGFSPSYAKLRTIVSLATSAAIFCLYFGAFGLVLKEFGVSLKAYLASASILGLAIGFGMQGLVQDVVTGLTLVFSDLYDVGDMVEISGQTGIVRKVGMRFTVLENPLGAEVFIPNRSITNMVNYPKGYVRVLVDITLPRDPETAKRIEERVNAVMSSAREQFAGLSLFPPSIESRVTTSAGKEYLRMKFRIWPGRGAPIETAFRQELIQELKAIDPAFADWMVSVAYEVEKKAISLPPEKAPKIHT